MKPIGVQLYSVREAAAKDFPAVLKQIADMGYKGVEFAGLQNHTAQELGKIVSDLGMVVCSSHEPLPTKENINEIVDRMSTWNCKQVVGGFGGDDMKTLELAQKSASAFATACDLLAPHGMSFSFHNHWWEFTQIGDKYAYDILMEGAPTVGNELDIYWTTYGKADAKELIAKYKSRIDLMHVKDGNLEEGVFQMTAVGSGKVDIPGIIKAAEGDTLKWVIVELDACETDMIEAVAQSYTYLTSNGLAAGNK